MELEGDFNSERGLLLACGGNESGAAEGVVNSKSEESALEKCGQVTETDGTLGHLDDFGLLPARGGKKKRNRRRNKKGPRPDTPDDQYQNFETSEVHSEVLIPGSRVESTEEFLESITPDVSPTSETPSPSEASIVPPKHLGNHKDYVKQDGAYVLNYEKHAMEVGEQLKSLGVEWSKGQGIPKGSSPGGRAIPCAPNPSVAEIDTSENADSPHTSLTEMEIDDFLAAQDSNAAISPIHGDAKHHSESEFPISIDDSFDAQNPYDTDIVSDDVYDAENASDADIVANAILDNQNAGDLHIVADDVLSAQNSHSEIQADKFLSAPNPSEADFLNGEFLNTQNSSAPEVSDVPSQNKVKINQEFLDAQDSSVIEISNAPGHSEVKISNEEFLDAPDSSGTEISTDKSLSGPYTDDLELPDDDFLYTRDSCDTVISTSNDNFLNANGLSQTDIEVENFLDAVELSVTEILVENLLNVPSPSEAEIPADDTWETPNASETEISFREPSDSPTPSVINLLTDLMDAEFSNVSTEVQSNEVLGITISSTLDLAESDSDEDVPILVEIVPIDNVADTPKPSEATINDPEDKLTYSEQPILCLNTNDSLAEWKNNNPEHVTYLYTVVDGVIVTAMEKVSEMELQKLLEEEKPRDSESKEILKEFQEINGSDGKKSDSLNNLLVLKGKEDYEEVYPHEDGCSETIASIPAIEPSQSSHDSQGFPVFQEAVGCSVLPAYEEVVEDCRGIFGVIPIPAGAAPVPASISAMEQKLEPVSGRDESLHSWYGIRDYNTLLPANTLAPDTVASFLISTQYEDYDIRRESRAYTAQLGPSETDLTPEQMESIHAWYDFQTHNAVIPKGVVAPDFVTSFLNREHCHPNNIRRESRTEYARPDFSSVAAYDDYFAASHAEPLHVSPTERPGRPSAAERAAAWGEKAEPAVVKNAQILKSIASASKLTENKSLAEVATIPQVSSSGLVKDPYLMTNAQIKQGHGPTPVKATVEMEEIFLHDSKLDPYFEDCNSSGSNSAESSAKHMTSSYFPTTVAVGKPKKSTERETRPRAKFDVYGPLNVGSKARRASLGRRVLKGIHDVVAPIVMPCRKANAEPEDNPPARGRGIKTSASNPSLASAAGSSNNGKSAEPIGKKFGSLRRMMGRPN